MQKPNIGNVLSASFWFLPLVLVAGAGAAAFGLVALEEHLGAGTLSHSPFVLSVDPETARSLLSALATTVATIAATTFSLTIVALTLAAQQYTPRVLHNYMSDHGNQVTLGVLTGTFAFAVIALQAVRGDPVFVPEMAITVALALALASVAAFIYFIHHLASILPATNIAADIERRTLHAVKRTLVEHGGDAAGEEALKGIVVSAEKRSGYVQVVELYALVELMVRHDLTLTVECGAGAFVPQGAALAWLSPPERVSEAVTSRVRSHFKLGDTRTHQQDVEYGLYQLVDIAVRSLSPSFNAVTTASTCLDHIGSILRQLAPMDLPPSRQYGSGGTPRVIVPSPTFDHLLTLGLAQIRTFAEHHRVILMQLLEVLGELEEVTQDPDRRRLLVEHANHIAAAAERGIAAEVDRAAIRGALQAVGTRLRDAGAVAMISASPRS